MFYKSKVIAFLALVVPFLVSILSMIYYIGSISHLALFTTFNINATVVTIVFVVYMTILYLLFKKGKLSEFIKIKPKNRGLLILILTFCVLLISFLITISSRMNINYFLRDKKTEKITLIVVGKESSGGRRTTNYYIKFRTKHGDLHHKVTKTSYMTKYKLADKYEVEVNRGYYDGIFLLKRIE